MVAFVHRAHFIYDPLAHNLLDKVRANDYGAYIEPVAVDAWLAAPEAVLAGAGHVVIAAPLERIRQLLLQSSREGFSVGIVPIAGQQRMARALGLPDGVDAAIEFALRQDSYVMDLVLCNGQVILYRATFGWLPLLDEPEEVGPLRAVLRTLRKLQRIRLFPLKITTAGHPAIRTAASGGMLVTHHRGTLGSNLLKGSKSRRDGAVGLILTAPISVLDYLVFLGQIGLPLRRGRQLPRTIGFIKSARLRVESEQAFDVFIDGARATRAPVVCETLKDAARVNIGPELRDAASSAECVKDTIKTGNLPNEAELLKAPSSRLPFFSYASEDRFRELFVSLRQDAQTSGNYIALMVLSTMLATVGLYLDSAAVIIGAMLLAPLMAPLVSVSMGILRADDKLFTSALKTIAVGVVIALAAAALTTRGFSAKPVTHEMLGRLNPTLLDLAVAVFSGIAAAYAKSHKEIAQNLAGVAIAVALVPPLAVAGIGLGRGDMLFFVKAFLLFLTNMVGITLAAMFTFRVIGFSPVVRNKRGMGVMLVMLALISVPLYAAYTRVVDQILFEQSAGHVRYLVNGKYVIVREAKIVSSRGGLLEVDAVLLVREPLTREDLQRLKEKVQLFSVRPVVVRATIDYGL